MADLIRVFCSFNEGTSSLSLDIFYSPFKITTKELLSFSVVRLELLPVALIWNDLEYFYSPGRDASLSRGYPSALSSPVPIYTPGWRQRESKESCPRTQHNVPNQGSNLDRSLKSRAP